MKEGSIKKPKPVLPVEEPLFEVPVTWEWTRLGAITSYIQRGKSPKYAVSNGSLVVSQKCVQWTGLDLSIAKQITLDSLKSYNQIRFLRDGDLLWNSTGTGTIGRVIRLSSPSSRLVCDGHVTVVRCLSVEAEYIRTWLRTDHVYGVIEEQAAGATNQVELTARMANEQLVPLPPLAEQHRIVAKVDELMALLDRLEEARESQESTRDRLTKASYARLSASDTDDVSFRSHARFTMNTLPALTARADQIKHLRQTILNLAVRGKLVPQDPEDEPASDLLKRIVDEQISLVQHNEIRKKKSLEAIVVGQEPFPIPHSWTWSRLGNLFHLVTDGAHHTPKYTDAGVPFLSVKDISSGSISFRDVRFISVEQHRDLCKRCRPEKGDILLTKVGTTGIAVPIKTDREFSIFVSLALLKFSKNNLSQDFLCYLINSPFVRQQSYENTQGIGNQNLVLKLINSFALPVPPLGEQHRIVAKIDELMSICDQLETNLGTTDNTLQRLLESLIHETLAPALEREMEAAE